jgi:hypothetical protein
MGLSPERVFLVDRAEAVALAEGNIMKRVLASVL